MPSLDDASALASLALFAQLRFPIVWVPLAAVVGVRMVGLVGLDVPDPLWPATLLILLLFATDPKTMPQRIGGRILFGLALGVLMALGSALLLFHPIGDTYAKVVPIPILNALAPQLDRLGDPLEAAWARWIDAPPWWLFAVAPLFFLRFLQAPILVALLIVVVLAIMRSRSSQLDGVRARLRGGLSPSANRVHVVLWLVVAATALTLQKPASLQAYALWVEQPPHVVEVPPGSSPTCEANPVWCESFSFVGEARLWLRR